MTEQGPFLTVEQVAARLGKTKRDAIYRWIQTGELKAINGHEQAVPPVLAGPAGRPGPVPR